MCRVCFPGQDLSLPCHFTKQNHHSIPSPKETPKQNGKPNYLFIALFILSSCMFQSLNYVLLLIGILILWFFEIPLVMSMCLQMLSKPPWSVVRSWMAATSPMLGTACACRKLVGLVLGTTCCVSRVWKTTKLWNKQSPAALTVKSKCQPYFEAASWKGSWNPSNASCGTQGREANGPWKVGAQAGTKWLWLWKMIKTSSPGPSFRNSSTMQADTFNFCWLKIMDAAFGPPHMIGPSQWSLSHLVQAKRMSERVSSDWPSARLCKELCRSSLSTNAPRTKPVWSWAISCSFWSVSIFSSWPTHMVLSALIAWLILSSRDSIE